MGIAERRARDKEDRKRSILDAARDLFVTEDYKGISMRRIAERIEYSPTAIYLYFKDKKDILFHLVQEGSDELAARLAPLDDIVNAEERLRKMGVAYLEFARTQPQYYRIMFNVEDYPTREDTARRAELTENSFQHLRRCVEDGVQQKRFRGDVPIPVLAFNVLAHIHGAVSLANSGRLTRMGMADLGLFFQTVIESAIRGIST